MDNSSEMNPIFIYHCHNFCEIISLVIYEALRDNEISCQLSRDVENHPDDIWILFCHWFDRYKKPKRYIVYQTEPTIYNYHKDTPYLKFLFESSQIWEYSRQNMPFLQKFYKGEVFYLPFRYAKCLETWNEPCGSLEIPMTDVYFIGNMTGDRQEIIKTLQEHGIQITYPLQQIWGKEREKQVKNARINLILHAYKRYRSFPQDISRIFPFGAKRCFMISELIDDCEIHSLIQCPSEQLPEKINFYLQNESYREQNIEQLYREIRSLTMANEIKRIMLEGCFKTEYIV